MSSIQINFVRNSRDGGLKDDIMFVKPSEVNNRLYKVIYEDPTGYARNRMLATEREVLDFVESMFALIPVDDDPFECVQVTCPMFPAILLRVSDMNMGRVRTAVSRIITNTLRNWPQKASMSTRALRNAKPLSS